MSLLRIALRYCIVKALKGATIVGDNVEDSAIGALQVSSDGQIETPNTAPFIAVYTDNSKIDLSGQAFAFGDGAMISLVIEWCTSASMAQVEDETGATNLGINLPVTSANMEMQQDIVGRQIIDALRDPENEYSAIARELIGASESFELNRVSSGEDGHRLAAHQFVYRCTLINEPRKGDTALRPLPRLFELLEASPNPDDQIKAGLMKALLEGELSDLRAFQLEHGLGAERLEALGLREGADG